MIQGCVMKDQRSPAPKAPRAVNPKGRPLLLASVASREFIQPSILPTLQSLCIWALAPR
jgi:hypothetical protein